MQLLNVKYKNELWFYNQNKEVSLTGCFGNSPCLQWHNAQKFFRHICLINVVNSYLWFSLIFCINLQRENPLRNFESKQCIMYRYKTEKNKPIKIISHKNTLSAIYRTLFDISFFKGIIFQCYGLNNQVLNPLI